MDDESGDRNEVVLYLAESVCLKPLLFLPRDAMQARP